MNGGPARRSNLRRLLAPRHVAFIGGRVAEGALRRCAEFGFEGELWHVNPRAVEARPGRIFPSVEALPAAPDAAYLAVSTDVTIDTVRSLAERGAGGCICFAAGFSEKGGAGVELERALIEAAGDMALVGPNCYGLLDYRIGLHLWSGAVRGRYAGPGIAIVSQSGALAEFMTMERRSVPLVCVVSVGNQAVLGLEEVVDAMLEDPGIKAIGLYVEGLRDVSRFSLVAARALSRGVPMVALKAGRSEAGARLALGHTSSLAGTAELYDALFERFAVAQADSLSEFLEALKLLAVAGPLPGARVAAVTASGGEAALLADRAGAYGVTFPALSEAQVAALRAGLPDYVNPMNPLDQTVGSLGDPERQRLIYEVMAESGVDLLLATLDAYEEEDAPYGAETVMMFDAMRAAAERRGLVGVAASAMVETLPGFIRRRARAAGIAPLQGIEETLFAIGAGAAYGERLRRLAGEDPAKLVLPAPPAPVGTLRTLDEVEAKARLAALGLRVPRGAVASASEVVEAAGEVGFPVVLKVLDPALMHKSEAGAVALGLRDADAVAEALSAMRSEHAPAPPHFLVEEMVGGAVAELIVGIKRDPGFGQALVIGAGGVLVELLRDSATLLLPTDRDSIQRAVERLRVMRLLEGFRGRPRGDVTAAIAAIEALARFAVEARDHLVEMDVNPLLVLEEGRGVVAADALMVLADDSRP